MYTISLSENKDKGVVLKKHNAFFIYGFNSKLQTYPQASERFS